MLLNPAVSKAEFRRLVSGVSLTDRLVFVFLLVSIVRVVVA
jgi:hypothetical protein